MDDMSGNDEEERDDPVSNSLQEQLTALKGEMAKLSSSMSEGVAGAREKAGSLAGQALDQAKDVADVARTYPTAMGSATIVGGLVGLAIGLMIGQAVQPRHWYDRHWR